MPSCSQKGRVLHSTSTQESSSLCHSNDPNLDRVGPAPPRTRDPLGLVESLSCRCLCGFRINRFVTGKVLGCALQSLKWLKLAVTLTEALCPGDTVPKMTSLLGD